MSTLQRSSYSFRRQGSSGRIWDNRLAGREIKVGCEPEANGTDHEKVQQNRSIHNHIDGNSRPALFADMTAAPKANKVRKFSIGAIFGSCARPSGAS
ncbi:unnamed protein product [Coffea canephora]|uniref:DH200=94 genomic scaffold, scaffold_1412 n=1 Tax=Coffea canephora TaxID=49390 RepID=A0A068VIS1_COFCA|nr:unnamed protein product [Coffea canephora]